MQKLIIAEDEFFVRIGLEHAINWEDYQIELVATASDGDEALALYKKHNANIIITDLNMPNMDGINLIREIRLIDKEVKFIILTYLEDFHKAQEAMKYGVSYYFTKYDLQIDELKLALAQISKDLFLKNANAPYERIKINSEKTAEEKMQAYLFGDESPAVELFDVCNQESAAYFILELCVQNNKRNEVDSDGTLFLSVLNVVRQFIKGEENCHFLTAEDNRIILLYTFYSNANQTTGEQIASVISSANLVLNMIRGYLNPNITCFVGKQFFDIHELKKQLTELQRIKYLVFYFPEQTIFQDTKNYFSEVNLIVQKSQTQIISFCKEKFGAGVDEDFSYFGTRVINCDLSDAEYVKNLMFHWGQILVTIMHLPHEKANQITMELLVKKGECQSFNEVVQILLSFIAIVKESIDESSATSEEIMNAIEHIRAHLHEQITLSSVAKHVNFSAGYLSYTFKRELNISFTDFVLKMRIKKAKLLLSKTDDKLYQIAEQTGFQDASYFNRVFKRIVGITPNKYRMNYKGSDFSEKT